jgi:hypothetical protein
MIATETFTYYIGDLCYVLTNEQWGTVCDLLQQMECDYDSEDVDTMQECEGYLEPDLFDWDRPDDSQPFWIFSTAYGDGTYTDTDGRFYGVDSGTLGIIDVNYIEDTDKLKKTLEMGLGHLHTFKTRIERHDNYNDGGVLVFGSKVVIDTVGFTGEYPCPDELRGEED